MSLQEVEVSRKEVLDIVKQNKQKHDIILSNAIEGFWIEAEKYLKKEKEEQLKQMKKNYQKSVKDLKKRIAKELDLVSKRKKDGPFSYMNKIHPEDHTDDYIGVIRKLELCKKDTIELNSSEFDQYIRNKWNWRSSFLTTNTAYWGTGSLAYYGSGSYGISASYASPGLTASYSNGGFHPKVYTKEPTYSIINADTVDF